MLINLSKDWLGQKNVDVIRCNLFPWKLFKFLALEEEIGVCKNSFMGRYSTHCFKIVFHSLHCDPIRPTGMSKRKGIASAIHMPYI